MKTLLPLFGLIWLNWFSSAFAQASQPGTLIVRDSIVFNKMAPGIESAKLLRLYRSELRVQKVSRNRHDPATKDSLLIIKTATDYLELVKNQHNSFLIKADFTSTRVSFGSGIRIGVSKADLCKVYRLNPNFQNYQILETPEEIQQLRGYPNRHLYQVIRAQAKWSMAK